MKILMLSWEYPPRIVGGISRVVHDLAQTMAKKGHEVHVVTCSENNEPEFEKDKKVFVHRVHTYSINTTNFVDWVMQLNFSLLEKATKLASEEKFDIIHAHDWVVAYAAKTLKQAFSIPLISTIHATEHGRNQGLHNDMQRYISSVEWLLTYESWRVICNSEYMKNETRYVFQLPEDKLKVINNGVQIDLFDGIEKDYDYRRNFANDNEKIILFVGRLVQEKGVQILLDSVPKIVSRYNDVKFVIAGKGPLYDQLRNKADSMDISQKLYFTGYLSEENLMKLYKCADIAVFPSLYEPFGIVALEGMVANVPVVVTDTCGLGEIVEHCVDGMKAYTGNQDSLADCILSLLFDYELAEKVKANALKKVNSMYNWEKISDETLDTYKEVITLDKISRSTDKDETRKTGKKKVLLEDNDKEINEKMKISKAAKELKDTNNSQNGTEEISLEEMIIKSRKHKVDTTELH
jgi:glycosyltransferase involved in cell wall biosynthesis